MVSSNSFNPVKGGLVGQTGTCLNPNHLLLRFHFIHPMAGLISIQTGFYFMFNQGEGAELNRINVVY
jgi:hypothetical protein